MYGMFQNCKKLIKIPELNTENVTNMGQMFYGCSSLETIPELDTSNVKSFYNTFYGCSSLKDFGGLKNAGKGFSPTTGTLSSDYRLNFSNCYSLTHESLINIINNLYDIGSAGIQIQQLQLGSTNKAKLTDDEIAIAVNKGWRVD